MYMTYLKQLVIVVESCDSKQIFTVEKLAWRFTI